MTEAVERLSNAVAVLLRSIDASDGHHGLGVHFERADIIEAEEALEAVLTKPAEGEPVAWPDREAVALADCPPGLFLFNGTLGFKTEYRGMEPVGPVNVPGDQVRWRVGEHSEAYVVSSGEAFWGGVTKKDDREALLVTPVDADAILALSASAGAASFQERVGVWMLECFGPVIPFDKVERNDRFIEEALELTQATGYSRERAHALVDYVFDRPIGEPSQEVGGVMVTLAALCNVHGLDFTADGLRELERIEQPAIMAKIKAKQAAKPTGSALPAAMLSASAGQVEGEKG